jgi:hypothetical protein
MAFDATQTTAVELAAVDLGGQISESVLQTLFDISNIPLPITDRIGVGSHDNAIHEWTIDRLAAPAANVVAEGDQDLAAVEVNGIRVRNHSQISAKKVKVSEKAQASGTIGFANKLADALSRRGNEARRDVEFSLTANVPSVAEVGDGATGGQSAGLEAWIAAEDIRGTATGAVQQEQTAGTIAGGGWLQHTAGVIPAYTYQAATVVPAVGHLTKLEACAQAVWELGANPTLIVSRPKIIAALSKHMFTSTANIATLQSDQGVPREGLVAVGAVNVFLTNFGITLAMVPSRLQGFADTAASPPDSSTLFVLDPSMLEISYMQPWHVSDLAKTGLFDTKIVSATWTLVVKNWEGLGMVQGLDEALAIPYIA